MTNYEATFTDNTGERINHSTVTGAAPVVAAWLRALADHIDPPKRPTRAALPSDAIPATINGPFAAADRIICRHCGKRPGNPRCAVCHPSDTTTPTASPIT